MVTVRLVALPEKIADKFGKGFPMRTRWGDDARSLIPMSSLGKVILPVDINLGEVRDTAPCPIVPVLSAVAPAPQKLGGGQAALMGFDEGDVHAARGTGHGGRVAGGLKKELVEAEGFTGFATHPGAVGKDFGICSSTGICRGQ